MKRHLTLITALVLSTGPLQAASGVGTTAANFLKIGNGARASAMGDAQAAVGEDVNAAHYNPASLTQLRFNEVSLMHFSLVEGVRYQQANFGMPTEKLGTFGFGISLMDYGDINGFDQGGLPTGEVKARNMLISGAWGKRIVQ